MPKSRRRLAEAQAKHQRRQARHREREQLRLTEAAERKRILARQHGYDREPPTLTLDGRLEDR